MSAGLIVGSLAGRGYAVVVDYLHDQRAAESTVELVLAANGAAVAVRADVTDELDVERLFAETIEMFGGIDVVVHAVGSRVAAAPVVASPQPGYGALATTKAATDALTRVLALELRARDITVNAVSLQVARPCAPGSIADVVASLVSEDGHRLTGQVIRIDDPR